MDNQILQNIQQSLVQSGIDGWLFYNFNNLNKFAERILGIDPASVQSRRNFCLIPATGEPVKLVHKIEAQALDIVPGKTLQYAGWKELEAQLADILQDYKTIAMEYSPGNAIPYISLVDGGTLELVREKGNVEVVTSANLIQLFESIWTEEQYQSHERAQACLYDCVDATFAEVARRIKEDGKTDEYSIQCFMMDYFKERGMHTYHAPIVAVNENSGNPHYEPMPDTSAEIKKGDFLLIDLWCKEEKVNSVYGDITWTAYFGDEIPKKNIEIFNIVAAARDAGVTYLQEQFAQGNEVPGKDVDDVVRKVIEEAGYGEYFIHRTGHSIGQEVHGNGANIDNLETRDERLILPSTCFSIEPGIYLPEFGVRSEIDVYIDKDKQVKATGRGTQKEIVHIQI